MLATELLEATRHRRAARTDAVDLVEPVQTIDAGPGRTHRSTIAHALMVALFADLLDRVPSGRSYARLQASGGRRIILDHGAVRTVAWPSAASLPSGIDQVRRVLEPLGWRHRETYPLRSISMTGTSWVHLDAAEDIAQWFVSEFHPDEFSPAFIASVERVLDTSVDPIEATDATHLEHIDEHGWLPDADAVELLPTLVRCFDRHHRLPTSDDYDRLLAESAEMAWIATEGTAFNHATDRVDDVEATAEEERISGRPIKETVETSGSGRVRQTAHRATMVERHLGTPHDSDAERPGAPVVRSVPGSFFEFIERGRLPDGSLDLAFDAANAQGIFAMTRRGDDDVPAESADQHAQAAGRAARDVARPAFTFKVRRRHLSPKRQREFDEWMTRWAVAIDGPPLDWAGLFDRDQETHPRRALDIGFGHGESTIAMARAEPDLDVIGVEVHDPGVVTVLDAIENEPLRNVRVVHGDVIRFLRRVEAGTLDVVRIFFPDPWTKVRQQHRRLVRDDVVAALTDRLRPGGVLHLATDIADYAALMRSVCDAEPRLEGGVVDRPVARPITRFEQRGIAAGRLPVDLIYQRR